MFRKVLIANRGEIALRINRACHELGVATVAIFSEADRGSLHVRHADEAFCVGAGPVASSYLNIANIISTALICGADAIHPGYGFLAENARFAEIARDHGLTFIGPAPSVIAAMGDKATARRIMDEAGVPTTPGSGHPRDPDEASASPPEIGYPVLLKATAGGGGKGMRVVEAPAEMAAAFATASAEAEASFKDGRMYVEKLIRSPRHIEVQVLGDQYGDVVHLGERDCSVQKPSHQKLIEEAPAAGARPGRARRGCTTSRVAAGRAVGVHERRNARVSRRRRQRLLHGDEHAHPGRASGDRDGLRRRLGQGADPHRGRRAARLHPGGSAPHGIAIEVRVNAEDPENNFAPAAGTLDTRRVSRRSRGARRHARLLGRRRAAVLRFDAGQDHRHRADARIGDLAHGTRAGRNAYRRCEDDRRLLPRDHAQTKTFQRAGLGVDWLPRYLRERAAGGLTCSTSRRLRARAGAQTLYGTEVGHRAPEEMLAETTARASTARTAARFVKDLVLGTLEFADESDAVIGPLLEGWTIERLADDRSHRCCAWGVFELRHRAETPPSRS